MVLNYTLAHHRQDYELTNNDILLFPLISPYATRHWDLAHQCEKKFSFGHKFIALLEYIPILGPLGSLIERVTVYVLHHFLKYAFVKPCPQEKMQKNLVKAIQEHHKEEVLKLDVLAIESNPSPLALIVEKSAAKGFRPTMEDAHEIVDLENGKLFCVFDGHEDSGKIAQLAGERFKEHFAQALLENPDDIRKAFSSVIDKIHQEVKEKDMDGGSTAVVCYIENATNIIYTATLADSEAKIYRKIEGKILTIPLSPIRDWKHPKEALRASIALNDPSIARKWPESKDAKFLRFPNNYGVNVSRAIGDILTGENDGKKGIIQKPKISMCQMKEDDLLIIACDGLWDFAKEEELNQELITPALANVYKGAAEKAVGLSRKHQVKRGNNDNVTVITALAKKPCCVGTVQ